MPWFKVDDGLSSSRKWLSIPKKHRFEALGVWTWAGSWSAKELTDGVIPAFMLDEWGVRKIIKDHLVSAGLWSEVPQNVRHLKWDEYQPMKADVEAEREKNREKLRKWREGKRGETGGVTGLLTDYEPDGNPAPVPTRPDPTLTTPKGVVRASRRKPEIPLPDDWTPKQPQVAYAVEFGIDLGHEVAQFKAHASANDRRQRDWDSAFRQWLGNAQKWSKAKVGPSMPVAPRKGEVRECQKHAGYPLPCNRCRMDETESLGRDY